MSRNPVWIEEKRFRGIGCSECSWVFNPSSAPTGNSFDEMMRNFELQRDKEFALHVCADHSGARTQSNPQCQNWEKPYRAAILEHDPGKLLQRIELAEAAILERSRSLSKLPGIDRREQEAITRALHILGLLRQSSGQDRKFHPELDQSA